MELKPSTRLASAVCAAQAVVIRPPAGAGVLSCGGAPMVVPGAASGAAQLSAPQAGAATPGKRYLDEASGLELLCAKAGFGAFAFDGRPLRLKEAKALPASD